MDPSLIAMISISAIMLIVSIIFNRFPPKKLNGFYGYRTRRSMRNKENWNFANKLAGQLLLFISVVITLLSVLAAAVLKNIFSEASLLIWINLFLVLGLAWLIYTVEVRTKEFEQSAKDSQ